MGSGRPAAEPAAINHKVPCLFAVLHVWSLLWCPRPVYLARNWGRCSFAEEGGCPRDGFYSFMLSLSASCSTGVAPV